MEPRRKSSQLTPGAVVRFSDVDTVAFSRRTQAAREDLKRFLGYSHAAHRALEEAQWAATRHHLAIIASTNSAAITFARYLHNAAPGARDRRFHVVAKLEEAEKRVYVAGEPAPCAISDRIPDDAGEQRALLDRTAFGALIVRADALPERSEDRARFFQEIASNAYKLRLMLIVPPASLERTTIEALVGAELRARVVDVRVPPLTERASDIPRIVENAIAFHGGAATARFTTHDRECLERQRWPDGHAEIEETISRLVMLRKTDSLSDAASLAGVKKPAFSMWAKKYGFIVGKPR